MYLLVLSRIWCCLLIKMYTLIFTIVYMLRISSHNLIIWGHMESGSLMILGVRMSFCWRNNVINIIIISELCSILWTCKTGPRGCLVPDVLSLEVTIFFLLFCLLCPLRNVLYWLFHGILKTKHYYKIWSYSDQKFWSRRILIIDVILYIHKW